MEVQALSKTHKRQVENQPKVVVSCSGRFHAFALAEQLEKHDMLTGFYTTYAYQKNILMRRFTSRVDKENIPVRKIQTALPIAMMMKLGVAMHDANERYDKWVAKKIKNKDYSVFIGWSGMSLHAIEAAKKSGKTTIVERGSSHILYQDKILREEYARFGIKFKIDPRTVEKELAEYKLADYISIPSAFVKNSFLEYGVPERKLIQNPYGSSSHFKKLDSGFSKDRFRVLYVGNLTVQKGLIYMFEAIKKLNLPQEKIEYWFIGKVDGEMKATVEKYAQPNWTFFGHVNFYDLPKYISACDVAVQPSLQEGLSMVIPQILSCGVPVVATTNTGGEDIITEAKNGFIIPVRNPKKIAEKIGLLFSDSKLLEKMKMAAAEVSGRDFSWDGYGERYVDFLQTVV